MPLSNSASQDTTSWNFQNKYVERVMDNASYTAAHPDDTLVLAGPARKPNQDPSQQSAGALQAIGMLQSIQFSQSKPTQPLMAIGSGRSFFVSGKAQTQFSIGRLFINAKNLLRVLYKNAELSGLDVSKFDDPAAANKGDYYLTNLDSELYYIPFGLACLFRSKARDSIGGFYAELCLINSYGVGVNAGQNMLMESVNGVADRILPFNPSDAMTNASFRKDMDAVLGFSADADNISGPKSAE